MKQKLNAHTPGPWKTYRGAVWSTHESVSGPVTKGMRTNHVCAISERLKMPDGEREANARLIAAAPDMLAALEAIISQMDQGGQGATQVFNRDACIQHARAAIAKARGEA